MVITLCLDTITISGFVISRRTNIGRDCALTEESLAEIMMTLPRFLEISV